MNKPFEIKQLLEYKRLREEKPILFYSTALNTWQAEAHKSMAREVYVIGGNRSGKTVFGATRSVFFALGSNPFCGFKLPVPNFGWAVANDFPTSREVQETEILRWAPKGTEINKLERTATFPNGSTIGFKTYEQGVKSFTGRKLHYVWLDEPPPYDVFKEILMRLVDYKGYLWITMTPDENEPISWITRRIILRENVDKNVDMSIFQPTTMDNKHIPPEEIVRIRKEYEGEPERLLVRLEGKMIPTGGITFPMFNPAKHCVTLNL